MAKPFNIKTVDRKSRRWFQMKANALKSTGQVVDIGVFGSSGGDVVLYATKNEMGDPNNKFNGFPAPIPSRPFLRSTIDVYKNDIKMFIAKHKQEVVLGGITLKFFLEKLGDYVEGLVKTRIMNSKSWAAKNSDITRKIKGSDQPLVDTGTLVKSIVFKVRKASSSESIERLF